MGTFDSEILYLLPLVFFAYFCKAATGFGSVIIMVAIGSHIIGPLPVLILTSFLDVISGFTLLRVDVTNDHRRLWVPLSLAMFLGVVLGGFLIKLFGLQYLHLIVATALIAVSIWLIFFRYRGTKVMSNARDFSGVFNLTDLGVCLVAGTSGGMTGISAPPLLYYFGSQFSKGELRRLLTRIFLVESLTRMGMYIVIGAVRPQIFMIVLLSIPLMFAGIVLGNRLFLRISESAFGRIAGVVILGSAVRLLYQLYP